MTSDDLPYIELFTLDATSLTDASGLQGGIYHFCNTSEVTIDGTTYLPLPIQIEGIQFDGAQAPAQPTLTLGYVDPSIRALIHQFGYLTGATVEIAMAMGVPETLDASNIFAATTWKLDQATINKDRAAWVLRSLLDGEGLKIPRRFISRDYCPFTVRRWNGTEFDEEGVQCPYVWGNREGEDTLVIFDEQGNETSDESKEHFARTLKGCCELRSRKITLQSIKEPWEGFRPWHPKSGLNGMVRQEVKTRLKTYRALSVWWIVNRFNPTPNTDLLSDDSIRQLYEEIGNELDRTLTEEETPNLIKNTLETIFQALVTEDSPDVISRVASSLFVDFISEAIRPAYDGIAGNRPRGAALDHRFESKRKYLEKEKNKDREPGDEYKRASDREVFTSVAGDLTSNLLQAIFYKAIVKYILQGVDTLLSDAVTPRPEAITVGKFNANSPWSNSDLPFGGFPGAERP